MEFDLSGNYPLILAGEAAGEVRVSREGLYWSFEASCGQREELVRLSVYGEGKEGYLGVMEPAGENLRLSRRLSKSAMKGFPQSITHGGQRGEPQPAASPKEEASAENESLASEAEIPVPETEAAASENAGSPENSEDNSPPDESDSAEDAPSSPLNETKPPTLPPPPPPEETSGLAWGPCALPCSLFSGPAEKRLCGGITRAFLAREKDSLYLAAPAEAVQFFPKTPVMRFEEEIYFSGEKYLICKIKRNDCDARF